VFITEKYTQQISTVHSVVKRMVWRGYSRWCTFTTGLSRFHAILWKCNAEYCEQQDKMTVQTLARHGKNWF